MANYLPERTKVVTQIGANYLVRGSMPIVNNAFVYDEIADNLKSQIGNDFNLKNFNFIDFSLIDNVPASERSWLEIEYSAYGLPGDAIPAYPPLSFNAGYKPSLKGAQCLGNPGQLIWFPIEGVGDGVPWNIVVDQIITDKGPGWNFDGCVDMLNTILTEQNGQPRVIYYHCTLGADRTGALTYGYLVKYGGKSPEEAKTIVNSVTPPNVDYQRLQDDYSKYLQEG